MTGWLERAPAAPGAAASLQAAPTTKEQVMSAEYLDSPSGRSEAKRCDHTRVGVIARYINTERTEPVILALAKPEGWVLPAVHLDRYIRPEVALVNFFSQELLPIRLTAADLGRPIFSAKFTHKCERAAKTHHLWVLYSAQFRAQPPALLQMLSRQGIVPRSRPHAWLNYYEIRQLALGEALPKLALLTEQAAEPVAPILLPPWPQLIKELFLGEWAAQTDTVPL